MITTRRAERPIADASGGRICKEKKPQAGPPRHPALIASVRDRAGRRGFSSCGHRLSSLYRAASLTKGRLTSHYRRAAAPCFFSFQILNSNSSQSRLGRA